ncbi:hypothetical protein SAMN05661093_00667 [Kibdelosporangium aridum]|uniref:Uncharacterized protein n=1 Tax=Kibdelosporangium aridum TaxID=2030 RepID=A0A1W2ABK3_KIBAR|nr:hypothetical protein SAMN05661093_00667 [Kibdelosporangium aridum]
MATESKVPNWLEDIASGADDTPAPTMKAMTIVAVALLLAWPLYNVVLAVFAWRRPRPRQPEHTTGLHFWIVIPASHEQKPALLESVLALDSPEYPVRVLVARYFGGRNVGAVQCRVRTRGDKRYSRRGHAADRNVCLARRTAGPGLVWGLVHRARFGAESWRRTLVVSVLYPIYLGLRRRSPHSCDKRSSVDAASATTVGGWQSGFFCSTTMK